MARNIVFLGIKHCGKSTHGKLLAARLKREFFDTDDLLVAYYRRKYSPDTEDISPRWIMRQHGEEFFRRTEAETVLEVLQNNPAGGSVLALGGGVPENRFLTPQNIKSLGVLVHLLVDPEIAYSRVLAGGLPPFLAGEDPHGKFMDMARARMQKYSLLADLQINIPADTGADHLNNLIFEQLVKNGFLSL